MEQQQINIRPEDTTGVDCPKCHTQFFIPVYLLRKVSAIVSPSGQEEVIQVPVMACANCGTPMMDEKFDNEEEGDGSTIITP